MSTMRACLLIVMTGAVLALHVSVVRAGEDWPNWRGPHLNGTSEARNLPAEWSESKNIVWKSPLPHWSGSSPVIANGRLFVLSASKSTPDDKAGVGRAFRSDADKSPDAGGNDIILLCFDVKSGEQKWAKKISGGNEFYAKHNMASTSPVTDGKHVWAVSGTGVIAAFDYEGNKLWDYDLQKQHGKFGLYWGYASSPLLLDDKLIV